MSASNYSDSYGGHTGRYPRYDSDSDKDDYCDNYCAKPKHKKKTQCYSSDDCDDYRSDDCYDSDDCGKKKHCKTKKKCGRRKCPKPKYCSDKPWPPYCKPRCGSDLEAGVINANIINASDAAKAPPQKLYVPSDLHRNLAEALASLKSTEDGGPIGGYHIIMRHGRHDLASDFSLPVANLILEAQSYTPTMANAYFVNHGHSHDIIPDYINYYNKCIGGLGPFKLQTCGDKVTVYSGNDDDCHRKQYNPNFGSLCYGDTLHWRKRNGKICCYTIRRADCNSIWIKGCFDKCQPCEGEGFWIGNRTEIRFCGGRRLQLVSGGQLEYRGLHLTISNNRRYRGTSDSSVTLTSEQLVTGAIEGVTQFIHSHMASDLLVLGGMSNLYPCILTSFLRLTPGTSGTALYQGIINPCAQIELDQANMAYLGALLLGTVQGITTLGSASMSFLGSSAYGNKTAAKILGGTFNYLGTAFSNNEKAIECDFGDIFSTTGEYHGLAPPAFIANELAIVLNNKSSGWSNSIVTVANTTDLTLDGTAFALLSDYISNTPGALFSTLRYLEHSTA
jgi:hypothetical protein